MADLYLERIGLVNPTIVKRDNNGKIERLESVGLDMASLVAFWRKCFDLDGLLFEKITLHCKSKDFNAMGQRTLATCRSVRELLAEQGVECVIDDEWFKNHQVKNEEVEQADERIDKMSKGQVMGILSQVPNPPSNEQYRDFLKNRKAAVYKEKLFKRAGENSEIFGNCVVTLADINDLFEEVFGNDEE